MASSLSSCFTFRLMPKAILLACIISTWRYLSSGVSCWLFRDHLGSMTNTLLSQICLQYLCEIDHYFLTEKSSNLEMKVWVIWISLSFQLNLSCHVLLGFESTILNDSFISRSKAWFGQSFFLGLFYSHMFVKSFLIISRCHLLERPMMLHSLQMLASHWPFIKAVIKGARVEVLYSNLLSLLTMTVSIWKYPKKV